MWIRLSDRRMEIAAPCGCLESFFLTPEMGIERSTLASRCGKADCEYNSGELLGVSLRVAGCLRQSQFHPPARTSAPTPV